MDKVKRSLSCPHAPDEHGALFSRKRMQENRAYDHYYGAFVG